MVSVTILTIRFRNTDRISLFVIYTLKFKVICLLYEILTEFFESPGVFVSLWCIAYRSEVCLCLRGKLSL